MTPLLEYTVKVSLVVLAGLVASALLRRRSAAARHWVLSLALIFALALPLIGRALPTWSVWSVTLGSATARPRPGANVPTGARPSTPAVGDHRAIASAPVPAARPVATASLGRMVPVVWAAGTVLSLLLLVVGLARLTWLSSRARPVTDPLWTRVLDELTQRDGLRRMVRVLQSEHPSLLVTWGAFRPTVLVPRLALDWPEDRIRVVLSHELAHIRRGDWAVQMVAELLRSIYWFNPLLWIACRSLRQESEEACDDEVIASGVEGSDYAAHLLDAARALKRDGARWVPAPAIVRRSSLERRIRVMLNTGLRRTPATRAFRVAAALSLLGATTLVAAAQIGPAALSGSVVDSTGAPVPGVAVRLASTTSAAKFEVETDGNGQFQFVPLPAEAYVLRARFGGFKDTEETVRLAGKPMRRDIKLALGSLTESVSIVGGPSDNVDGRVSGRVGGQVRFRRTDRPVPGQPGSQQILIEAVHEQDGVQRVLSACTHSTTGGDVRAPLKLRDVRPVYPQHLQASGVTGTVLLSATIGTDGKVASVDVTRSVHPDLDAAAIDAVRQWVFLPTLLNCSPMEVAMNVSLRFSVK